MIRILFISLFLLLFSGCELDQSDDAVLPGVGIEDGQVPKYRVEESEIEIEERLDETETELDAEWQEDTAVRPGTPETDTLTEDDVEDRVNP